MTVSVEDIGRRAGVGRATAYRVLTNSPRVSDAIRARVMAAVQELGYPRVRPRSKTGRSGYVLWSPLAPGVEPDTFFRDIYGALESAMAARRSPVRSISFPLDDPNGGLPPGLARENFAGIFTVAFYSMTHLRVLAARWPLACLLSTRRIPGAISIAPDYAAAAAEAVRMLAGAGHRRIGLVTGAPRERNFSCLFTEGYAGALTVSGLCVEAGLIHAEPGNLGRVKPEKPQPLGLVAGRALLSASSRPTAIIARHDSVGGLLAAAATLGLRVPEDVSVVGFGTKRMAAEFSPHVTSFCFSPDEMVTLALKAIGSIPEQGCCVFTPVEVFEGESVRRL